MTDAKALAEELATALLRFGNANTMWRRDLEEGELRKLLWKNKGEIITALRAQPQALTGCLHPGNQRRSCQYEGKCQSASCNHYGKTVCRPRMTLEAQDPKLLYPPKEMM